MNKLNNISNAIDSLNSTYFNRAFLFGDKNFDNVTSLKVIKPRNVLKKFFVRLLIC